MNGTMKKLLWLPILSLLLISCSNDSDLNHQPETDNTCFEYNACNPGFICQENTCVEALEITKDTVIITQEESQNSLLKTEENTLVFMKNERTSLFKKDYILAFEETDVFENGFIGRITSVETQNNQIIVKTEEVSPFEILADTRFDLSKHMEFDTPIDPSTSTSGKTVTKALSYNKSLYRNSLKFSGDMTIKYDFDMFIDIRRYANTIYTDYHLIKFDMKNNVELTNNLNFQLHAINYNNEKINIPYSSVTLMGKEKITTFTTYLPYRVKTKGEVYMSVKALYSGNLEGKANIQLNSKSSFNSRIRYANKQTSTTTDQSSNQTQLTDDVKVNGRASVTFVVTPEVKFSSYISTVKNNVTIGSEIKYTQALLNSEIKQSSTPEACYSLNGSVSINPYASLDMMTLYRSGKKASNGVYLTWKKSNRPKLHNISWLNNTCETFTCSTHEDCRVTQASMADSCQSGTCRTESSNTYYEFIDIPEGNFMRGCVQGDEACRNDETPAKNIQMSAYKIGKYEVTVAQYKECVDAGSCERPTAGNFTESSRDNHPINGINWQDAQRFCAWLGGNNGYVRLPTEAEWEYAAKGDANHIYPWGNQEPTCELTTKENEDGNGCGENMTSEVGSKASDRSPFGVMDMAGNVSEYVGDYYDPSYYHKEESLINPKGPIKPTGSNTYMTARGSNWKTQKISTFRNSRRFAVKPTVKDANFGFRCAYQEKGTSLPPIGTVDNPIELGTLNPGYTHTDARNTKEATSDFFDSYPDNTVPEYGKEFIYHFTVTQKIRIRLSISDPEPSGTDIDLQLFRLLNATNPGLIERDDKRIEAVLEPGEYYISMDSYGRDGRTREGAYTLNIEVEDATSPVGCDNLSLIELNTTTLPFNHTDARDTNNAPNDCFDTYPSNTAKEFGKEYIYHFKLTKKAEATFYIQSPEPNGTDVDLQLFKTLDKENPNLIARDDRRITSLLEPGDYYFSVDSYGAEGATKEGRYNLTIKIEEFVPVPAGEWFNPYMLKAVKYIEDNHSNGGYNIRKRYTHELKYGDASHNAPANTGHLAYYTGGPLTMCSAAVTEVIIVAMQIYAKETGDWTVFDKFTRSQWDNKFIPWQFPMGSTGSKGLGDTVNHFNMGKHLEMKDLRPGAGMNYSRTTGYGHAVIFLGFLDKEGNIYDSYPSGKTIIGFKYFSSQSSTNGMGYRLAIWSQYTSWATSNFCNSANAHKRNGLGCDKNLIQTGTYRPNAGMLYMPNRWNPF